MTTLPVSDAATVDATKAWTPRGLSQWVAGRRMAVLGGTTTWGDCLALLRYLVEPRRLIRGPIIAEYERAFADKVGVRFAYSFAHGRVGLYGLLYALGIGPGDEVLLQVPTHIVVANAIRYTGARPVYVDCQLDTYTMDLEQAGRRITPRTKALVLQHTFGIPADLDGARALARRHGVEIIEDCVHALGATYDGAPVGSHTRCAFFSTEETKTISTTMGGMVVTDDPELAARIADFQAHCAWPSTGMTARYMLKLVLYHILTEPHVYRFIRILYERLGKPNPLPRATSDEEVYGERPLHYKLRLSNAQALLGLRQLRRLDRNLAHRRAVAAQYTAQLSKTNFAVPHPPAKAIPALLRYPVWVDDREAAMRATARHATLGTWFTSVLEEAASPMWAEYVMGSCPCAEDAARHLVNLPTHPRVSSQDVAAIVRALVSATRGMTTREVGALAQGASSGQ